MTQVTEWVGPLSPQALATATPAQAAAVLKAATRQAFMAESTARQRDPYRIGLSSMGRCRRRNAYALARTPITDTPPAREGREANLGTWEHAGLLPQLAAGLGGETEVKVVLKAAGLELYGSIDLDIALGPVDLKTVGEHRLQRVRRSPTILPEHRFQVSAYALARLQSGRPVRQIAVIYMDRATGEDEVLVETFTNAAALAVIDRIEQWQAYAAQDPDMAPRDERGPGMSFACDECWWLKRCWGPDATPRQTGPQSVSDRADIINVLAEYAEARDREGQAKKDKEWAAARLERVRYGLYGPADSDGRAWKYHRQKDSEILDQREAVATLERHGLPVPKKFKRGGLVVKMTETIEEPK